MRDTIKQAYKHLTDTDDGYVQTKIGLMRKRAALVGELEGLNREVAVKAADLRTIEAALRLLEPSANIEGMPVRQFPAPFAAFRGEVARFFLGTLRGLSEGMTTQELALSLMVNRQMDVSDSATVSLIQKRSSHSLQNLRKRGFLRSEKADPSGMLRWWLLEDDLLTLPEGGWRNGST